MNLNKILILARKHLGKGNMESSARLCLSQAIEIQNAGADLTLAAKRALKSIAFSVGILHADYKKAWKASGFAGEPRLP